MFQKIGVCGLGQTIKFILVIVCHHAKLSSLATTASVEIKSMKNFRALGPNPLRVWAGFDPL